MELGQVAQGLNEDTYTENSIGRKYDISYRHSLAGQFGTRLHMFVADRRIEQNIYYLYAVKVTEV
jgi:hypothetical protein